jgi:hypothetical protein
MENESNLSTARIITPHLFLCHSHKDKEFVRRLARDLSGLSIVVWFDEWQLEVGDSLLECIGRALKESAYTGVILSPNSTRSLWCKAELEQALAQERRTGRKIVLPLLYRRVRIPPFLEGRFYLNFSGSYYSSLAALSGFLHGIDRGTIAQLLSRFTPRNLDQVKLILSVENRSPFRTTVLDGSVYQKIQKLLGLSGVNIRPDYFTLISGGGSARLRDAEQYIYRCCDRLVEPPWLGPGRLIDLDVLSRYLEEGESRSKDKE